MFNLHFLNIFYGGLYILLCRVQFGCNTVIPAIQEKEEENNEVRLFIIIK